MDRLIDRFWNSPRPILIVGSIFLIAGFLTSDIPVMIASRSWPSTEGIIISKTLVGQQFKEYDGDLYLNIDVYLRYEYAVLGEFFSSTRLNAIMSAAYSKNATAAYQEGKIVDVYYDPRNPSRAVLEPGFTWSPKVFDVFSVLFILASVFLIRRGIKTGLVFHQISL